MTKRITKNCKHCGEEFVDHVHVRTGLGRCDPVTSSLPYGYNAEESGVPCDRPCMGVTYPDPKESPTLVNEAPRPQRRTTTF